VTDGTGAPVPPDTALPRWRDEGWLREARSWFIDRLVETGVDVGDTPVEQVRAVPWSTLMRIATGDGVFWFKANAAGVGHEAGLVAVLARHCPGHVLRPVAVDAERGWLLLPDGGRTMRQVEGASADLAMWERMLVEYAEMQRAAEPYVDEMLAAGTPDGRPERLPIVRDALLADRDLLMIGQPDGLTMEQLDALVAGAPAYAEMCAELAAIGVPSSLQHDDLHDNNVFAPEAPGGPMRVFDWGDAVVGQPFGTLLVTLRVVEDCAGLPDGAPELLRLRDAYLEPWTDRWDRATLEEACRLALRVGSVLRSDCYRRALLEATPAGRAELGDRVSLWLLEGGQPTPLEPVVTPGQ
jgi:hypothetical protein